MTEITNQNRYEIRLSARSIVEEKVASRGTSDPEVVDLIAKWLFAAGIPGHPSMRTRSQAPMRL